jgi:hypothetical protein
VHHPSPLRVPRRPLTAGFYDRRNQPLLIPATATPYYYCRWRLYLAHSSPPLLRHSDAASSHVVARHPDRPPDTAARVANARGGARARARTHASLARLEALGLRRGAFLFSQRAADTSRRPFGRRQGAEENPYCVPCCVHSGTEACGARQPGGRLGRSPEVSPRPELRPDPGRLAGPPPAAAPRGPRPRREGSRGTPAGRPVPGAGWLDAPRQLSTDQWARARRAPAPPIRPRAHRGVGTFTTSATTPRAFSQRRGHRARANRSAPASRERWFPTPDRLPARGWPLSELK